MEAILLMLHGGEWIPLLGITGIGGYESCMEVLHTLKIVASDRAFVCVLSQEI